MTHIAFYSDNSICIDSLVQDCDVSIAITVVLSHRYIAFIQLED